ncbi:hypothetical protein H0H92_003694, partial [Tricholoma furcatifolium]
IQELPNHSFELLRQRLRCSSFFNDSILEPKLFLQVLVSQFFIFRLFDGFQIFWLLRAAEFVSEPRDQLLHSASQDDPNFEGQYSFLCQ